MMLSARTAIRSLLLVLALASGCGDHEGVPAGSEAVTLNPQARDPRAVVAKVNRVPILASEVAAQASATGTSPREAVQSLIQRELLAQEAARRGLTRHAEVQRAMRRALANLLIRRGFGDGFSERDVDPTLIARSYAMNRNRFVHPELVDVIHIVVRLGRGASKEAQRKALRVAREAHDIAAAGKLSPKEFREIVGVLREKYPKQNIRTETLGTPRRHYTVEDFAAAAFALKDRGEISPVVVTRFGYHVIYMLGRRPARNLNLAQATPEIRKRILPEAKRFGFERWVNELVQRYKGQIVAEPPAGGATRSTP